MGAPHPHPLFFFKKINPRKNLFIPPLFTPHARTSRSFTFLTTTNTRRTRTHKKVISTKKHLVGARFDIQLSHSGGGEPKSRRGTETKRLEKDENGV